MGAQLDRLRYEVFQNLFYSPMNTGILRVAVAMALTVYGIETITDDVLGWLEVEELQWRLPFTVLKLDYTIFHIEDLNLVVAMALTVYGIETS